MTSISPFAVAVAENSPYTAESVQIWLDYLDDIRFDYIGLGVQNVAQLLPYIVQTANQIRLTYETRPIAEQNKKILAALEKKTSDALARVNAGGGNRRTRRANIVFAKSINPQKGKEIATARQLAAEILQKQTLAESERIAAENPEFVEAVRRANAELNGVKLE